MRHLRIRTPAQAAKQFEAFAAKYPEGKTKQFWLMMAQEMRREDLKCSQ